MKSVKLNLKYIRNVLIDRNTLNDRNAFNDKNALNDRNTLNDRKAFNEGCLDFTLDLCSFKTIYIYIYFCCIYSTINDSYLSACEEAKPLVPGNRSEGRWRPSYNDRRHVSAASHTT